MLIVSLFELQQVISSMPKCTVKIVVLPSSQSQHTHYFSRIDVKTVLRFMMTMFGS